MSDTFWEVALNFRWPHEGFSIGWDIFNPDEQDDYTTVKIYLGLVTVIIEWGKDGNWYV